MGLEISSAKASAAMADIAAFYRACGYKGPLMPNDDVVTAREDGSLVGVVRLVMEGNLWLLRGMFVAEGRQRQGIGAKMLDEFAIVLTRRSAECCYLVCGAHLTGFYGRIGFKPLEDPAMAPHVLEKRRQAYAAEYGEQVIMRRLASTTGRSRILRQH